ncbi:MAG: hypothetical protein RR894_09145 [Terrisporobacter sp.]
MGTVIRIDSKPNLRFSVRATTIELHKDKYNEAIMKKHSVIVLENKANGKEVVHPINDFIYTYWKANDYNSMSSASFELCKFLNWLYFESDEKIEELSEITTHTCSRYLLSLTKEGCQKSTVKKHEKLLIKLIVYLYEKELLKNIDYADILQLKENSFVGVIYNKKERTTKIHEFKSELIIPFIETAFYETPSIALGVYYQIFGGLRSGEIVNISKAKIQNIGAYGEFGQIIKLDDNNFRPELTTTSGKGEIKVNRNQVIFPYKTLLKKLYKYHIEHFKATDGTNALFVNRDGKAMSGESYNYYFTKLKNTFIKNIESSNDTKLKTYAKYLKSHQWSTHIGRGLFSNLMAEYTDNILEVAVARGDNNLSSSLTYMADTKRIVDKIQNELELLYTGELLS